ncbi:hypothetical protein [Martelella radicis]|uniref:Uncharacterized protein n=1 Tax=Martelella radicis TaxID=1397476 RepID=A0A7W6KNT5_9HYPH|nr:hypothetical protein [Martelella radicis]MBB4124701.1 hypothetical protein [Martelella radicis]
MSVSQTAKLDLGFEVEAARDGSVIVSGKGVGLKLSGLIVLFLVMLLPSSFLFTFLINNGPLSFLPADLYIPAALAINAALVYAVHRLKSPPFGFRLTEGGLECDGKRYAYSDISEVFVDNGHAKGRPLASGGIHTGLIIGGTGPVGITAALTGGAGASASIAMANLGTRIGSAVNYRVSFRHGRNVIRLASSLDESTAISLFRFLTEGN